MPCKFQIPPMWQRWSGMKAAESDGINPLRGFQLAIKKKYNTPTIAEKSGHSLRGRFRHIHPNFRRTQIEAVGGNRTLAIRQRGNAVPNDLLPGSRFTSRCHPDAGTHSGASGAIYIHRGGKRSRWRGDRLSTPRPPASPRRR